MTMTLQEMAYRSAPDSSIYHPRNFQPLYSQFLGKLVDNLQPKHVLELGTGIGLSAAWMMGNLPESSRLTTINWQKLPLGEEVPTELYLWRKDPRFTMIQGDTCDVSDQVGDDVDFLFIDSQTAQNRQLISTEWSPYSTKLVESAIVCIGNLDLPGSDYRRFWDGIPYDKFELPKLNNFGFGIFQYRRDDGRH